MTEEEKVLTLVVADALRDKEKAQVVAEPEDEAYDRPENHITRFGTTMKQLEKNCGCGKSPCETYGVKKWEEQLKTMGAITTSSHGGITGKDNPIFGKNPKDKEDEEDE